MARTPFMDAMREDPNAALTYPLPEQPAQEDLEYGLTELYQREEHVTEQRIEGVHGLDDLSAQLKERVGEIESKLNELYPDSPFSAPSIDDMEIDPERAELFMTPEMETPHIDVDEPEMH